MKRIIELVAAETTGLDPDKDCVIEYAVLRLETGPEGLQALGVKHEIMQPPKGLQWSDSAAALHMKSGLLPKLPKGSPYDASAKLPLESCHLRIVWARDFVRKFLPAQSTAIGAAREFKEVHALINVMKGCDFEQHHRALGKVQHMWDTLKLIT